MPENFELEHADVLSEAQAIFVKKSKTRGQMWLDFPPHDKIRELRERVTRLENADRALGVTGEVDLVVNEMIEDSLDIINYAAFLIKQLRRGRR